MPNYFIEKLKALDKIPLPFLLVILFISLILILNYQQGPYFPYFENTDSINIKEGLRCVDKIGAGTLYEQDVVCIQGPFFYITLQTLKEIFQGNFSISILILSLLIYTFLFLILYNIVKKEVGGFYFLSLILYIIFVFIYGLWQFDFSILLAMFWFFSGFYILFYSDIRFKEFFSGCLFAISFVTKQTAIISIGVSIIFYSIKVLKLKTEWRSVNFKRMKEVFILIVTILLVILFFHILFPNFLTYTFKIGDPTLQSEELNIAINIFSDGFFTSFSKIFLILALQSDIVKIFLMSIIILTLYLFVKRRGFIETYVLFLVLTVSVVQFLIGNNAVEYRRILFVVFLFIVLFLKVLKESKGNFLGRSLLFLILLLLIYPSFKIIHSEHEVSELEEEVGYINHFMPKLDKILADKDRLRFYDYKYEYDITVLSRNMFGKYDPYSEAVLENTDLVDVDLWKLEELKAEGLFYSTLAKDIAEKKYDSIMYLLAGEGRSVNRLLGFIKGLSQEKNIPFKTLFPMECNLYIPTLEERCNDCDYRIRAYFLNPSYCTDIKQAMHDYYKDHFENICKKDKQFAGLVLNALIFDGITTDQKCEDGGNLLESYNQRYEITKTDVLFILIFFISLSTLYFYKKERRNLLFTQLKEGYRNNKRFLFILFLLILLIMGLYISSKIFVTCSGDWIKIEDDKGCCLDFNGDGICDEKVQKEDIRECILIENNKEILIGKSCSSKQECIKKAKQLDVPDYYLSSDRIDCKKTYFITLPEFIECNTDQKCLDSIENNTDLSEVVRCGKNGFCEMTELSMMGLGKFYSVKG